MKHTYLLIATLPSSPAPTEHTSSHPRKISNADCTTSYVLNSGVSGSLNRILPKCAKMIANTLLKSKLWSSNLFRNTHVTNEDRRQIMAESQQKLRILTAKTLRLLDASSPNLYTM